jgi:hypothetical protein
MRVGIDARKIADFGIGTYIRGLLGGPALSTRRRVHRLRTGGRAMPAGVEHVVVDAPHYSMRELLIVGRAADRARLDVFHAPHYVVPFTRVPLVVTIHDLIHLHQPMRNPLAPLYARAMIRRAVKRRECVLTVSETVKRSSSGARRDERHRHTERASAPLPTADCRPPTASSTSATTSRTKTSPR